MTVAKDINKTPASLYSQTKEMTLQHERPLNSDGRRRCIDVSLRKILWEDWISRGLLKPRCVKPSQKKEMTVNRKW